MCQVSETLCISRERKEREVKMYNDKKKNTKCFDLHWNLPVIKDLNSPMKSWRPIFQTMCEYSSVPRKYSESSKNLHMWTCLHQSPCSCRDARRTDDLILVLLHHDHSCRSTQTHIHTHTHAQS